MPEKPKWIVGLASFVEARTVWHKKERNRWRSRFRIWTHPHLNGRDKTFYQRRLKEMDFREKNPCASNGQF
jgi:hypothetical protein